MRDLLKWKKAFVAVLATSTLAYGQAGDECSNAVPTGIGNSWISNVGYTNSPEPWACGGGGLSVADRWFVFTPSLTQPYAITACNLGQIVDTILEVYEGSCGQLNFVACDDDSCGHFGLGAVVDTILNGGRTYYIRVATFASPGSFNFGIGAGSGGIAQVGPAGCGTATLEFSGTLTTAGNWLDVNVENASGTVLIGAGLTQLNVPFCGCTIAHEWLAWTNGPSWVIPIPPDPALSGFQFFVQGADITALGSCPANGVTLTSTYRITIG